MGMKTLYVTEQVLAQETEPTFELRLSAEGRQKACDMGLCAGDAFAVIDAAQDYFRCEAVSVDEDRLIVRIAIRADAHRRIPAVHLVQGLSDEGAMDAIVKQVAEIGVTDIIPFRAAASPGIGERKAADLVNRWRSLAQYSARQAGLEEAPTVQDVVSLVEACSRMTAFDAVLLCWEGETEMTIADAVSQMTDAIRGPEADIALVVGPRGGLSAAEMALLGDCNARLSAVSLGPSILRVETAGLIAPALLIYSLGDLR